MLAALLYSAVQLVLPVTVKLMDELLTLVVNPVKSSSAETIDPVEVMAFG